LNSSPAAAWCEPGSAPAGGCSDLILKMLHQKSSECLDAALLLYRCRAENIRLDVEPVKATDVVRRVDAMKVNTLGKTSTFCKINET
jgi:hypothetical protein